MTIEHRVVPAGEVRVTGSGHQVDAIVLRYNVLDDYMTRFRPGVFTASLEARMPRICWGHDWRDPIGRWVDFEDNGERLRLIGELDDFEAVPRARQASAQFASGTIDQFSVGFRRELDEEVDPKEVGGQRGVFDIVRGGLDEASPVLVGAVPGTELVSVRTAAGVGVVDLDAVVAIARQKAAGDLTEAEAEEAVRLLTQPPVATLEPVEEAEEVDQEALDAEVDAALEAIEDHL